MPGALREVIAKFGFAVDDAPLKQADKGVDALIGKLGNLGSLLVAGAVYQGIKGFVSDLRNTAIELRNTSARLGINVQEWQRWKFAAELADVSSEEMAIGLRYLERNAAEAASKGGQVAATFKKLGIQVKDSSGHVREISPLLKETAIKIAGIPNPAERTAAALQLFGRYGNALLPFFNKGKEGIEGLLGELDKLGGGLSDDMLRVLAESSKASKRFDASILSLKGHLAVALIPTLTNVVDWGTRTVVTFGKLSEGSNIFQGAMVALGAVGGAAALALLAPFVPAVALFGAIAIAVDELKTGIEGGKTVLGPFLDQLFGEGTGETVFAYLRGQLDALKTDLAADASGRDWAYSFAQSIHSVGTDAIQGFFQVIHDAYSKEGEKWYAWGAYLVGRFWAGVKSIAHDAGEFLGLVDPTEASKEAFIAKQQKYKEDLARETGAEQAKARYNTGLTDDERRVRDLDTARNYSIGPQGLFRERYGQYSTEPAPNVSQAPIGPPSPAPVTINAPHAGNNVTINVAESNSSAQDIGDAVLGTIGDDNRAYTASLERVSVQPNSSQP